MPTNWAVVDNGINKPWIVNSDSPYFCVHVYKPKTLSFTTKPPKELGPEIPSETVTQLAPRYKRWFVPSDRTLRTLDLYLNGTNSMISEHDKNELIDFLLWEAGLFELQPRSLTCSTLRMCTFRVYEE